MAASRSALIALLVVVSCTAAASAVTFTVGDTKGWSLSVDYATWASGKDFKVGDTLCECSALGKLAAIGYSSTICGLSCLLHNFFNMQWKDDYNEKKMITNSISFRNDGHMVGDKSVHLFSHYLLSTALEYFLISSLFAKYTKKKTRNRCSDKITKLYFKSFVVQAIVQNYDRPGILF